MRVLLVKDDTMIGEVIRDTLKDESYTVDWVQDGLAVASALRAQPYDLVLLDLGLPGKDGQDVLAGIRVRRDAVPGPDPHRAGRALRTPARAGRWRRRLCAQTLRNGGVAGPHAGRPAAQKRMRCPGSRQRFCGPGPSHTGSIRQRGPAMQLTGREFALLQALLIRPGAILSRGTLEDRIYGWGGEVESNVVDFLIHVLRRKLGNDVIQNVRGVGWRASKGG